MMSVHHMLLVFHFPFPHYIFLFFFHTLTSIPSYSFLTFTSIPSYSVFTLTSIPYNPFLTLTSWLLLFVFQKKLEELETSLAAHTEPLPEHYVKNSVCTFWELAEDNVKMFHRARILDRKSDTKVRDKQRNIVI